MHTNRRRSFLKLVLASTAAVAAYGAAQAASLDQIKKAHVIRIAVMQDDPPFGSIGPDMQPVGLDIELSNAIAKKLGVEVEFTPVAVQNRIPYLQTGKVDIIVADLGKTPERAKQIDYATQPYAMTFNGVFGAEDISVSDPAKLSGHTISSVRGSTEDLQMTERAPGDAIIKRFEDITGALSAYSSGQVDFFAMSSAGVVPFAKTSQRKFNIKFHLEDEPVYIGVPKGSDEFRAAIDGILAELKKDGTLNALSEKWLGNPLPQDF